MIDGRTVQELTPGGRSAKEIELLWAYIASQLDRLARRRVAVQPTMTGFGRRPALVEAG
jgi:chromosome partitioning protein